MPGPLAPPIPMPPMPGTGSPGSAPAAPAVPATAGTPLGFESPGRVPDAPVFESPPAGAEVLDEFELLDELDAVSFFLSPLIASHRPTPTIAARPIAPAAMIAIIAPP